MPIFNINLLAILVSAIATMAIGFVWYGPIFGAMWRKAYGWTKEDTKKMNNKAYMQKTYGMSFLGTLVTAYVLTMFLRLTQSNTPLEGLVTGFWVWLGFIAPVQMLSVLYGKDSWTLYYLNTGYQLVSVLVMGAILATWV